MRGEEIQRGAEMGQEWREERVTGCGKGVLDCS